MFKKNLTAFSLALFFCFFLIIVLYPSSCTASEYSFDSLQFFEEGFSLPENPQYQFSKSFSKNSTRYVWCLVKVKNLSYNVRQHEHEVTWRYYHPDGTLMGEQKAPFVIKPEWEYAWIPRAWGWTVPGNWKAGSYTAEVMIDGLIVGRDSFLINEDRAGILYKNIQFFEGPYDVPKQKDRIYQKRFPKSTTRYIYFSLSVKNLLQNIRPQKTRVYVRYYKPDGTFFGEPAIDSEIPADWPDADVWTGWGWESPGMWEAGVYRAEIFIAGSKVGEDRIEIYDDIMMISVYPPSGDVTDIINRGIAYYNKGEYGRAVTEYTKAIEIDPLNCDARYNRALAYDNQGEYDHAIADYTKVIELNPSDSDAYMNRGLVYDKKGLKNRAEQDYNKAGEKDVTIDSLDKTIGKKREKIYKTAVVEFTERGDLNVKDAGAIISEWMTSSMIETGVFEIYTRLSLKEVLQELEFQSTDFIDTKTAAKAGKIHGVEAIVTGSVLKFGNIVSVTVKLIDTETAKIIDSADIKAKSLDALSEKIDELALELSRE